MVYNKILDKSSITLTISSGIEDSVPIGFTKKKDTIIMICNIEQRRISFEQNHKHYRAEERY